VYNLLTIKSVIDILLVQTIHSSIFAPKKTYPATLKPQTTIAMAALWDEEYFFRRSWE